MRVKHIGPGTPRGVTYPPLIRSQGVAASTTLLADPIVSSDPNRVTLVPPVTSTWTLGNNQLKYCNITTTVNIIVHCSTVLYLSGWDVLHNRDFVIKAYVLWGSRAINRVQGHSAVVWPLYSCCDTAHPELAMHVTMYVTMHAVQYMLECMLLCYNAYNMYTELTVLRPGSPLLWQCSPCWQLSHCGCPYIVCWGLYPGWGVLYHLELGQPRGWSEGVTVVLDWTIQS